MDNSSSDWESERGTNGSKSGSGVSADVSKGGSPGGCLSNGSTFRTHRMEMKYADELRLE